MGLIQPDAAINYTVIKSDQSSHICRQVKNNSIRKIANTRGITLTYTIFKNFDNFFALFLWRQCHENQIQWARRWSAREQWWNVFVILRIAPLIGSSRLEQGEGFGGGAKQTNKSVTYIARYDNVVPCQVCPKILRPAKAFLNFKTFLTTLRITSDLGKFHKFNPVSAGLIFEAFCLIKKLQNSHYYTLLQLNYFRKSCKVTYLTGPFRRFVTIPDCIFLNEIWRKKSW